MQLHKRIPHAIAGMAAALALVTFSGTAPDAAEVMNNYCVRPPFIAAPVPPMVMFEIGRDHKLYYEA